MAHIHEKIDWTVGVFIVHKNRVLLRFHEKYHTLLAVGGHVELDEDPMTAAKRECLEEVGLTIHIDGEDNLPYYEEDRLQILPRPAGMNIHFVNDTHQHIDVIYYATSDNMEVTPENETDTWEWFTKEELEARDDILRNIKNYALEALAVLGTK